MKINTKPNKKTVFIDPNPVRVREMLDANGNVIDFRTKQIIRKADQSWGFISWAVVALGAISSEVSYL